MGESAPIIGASRKIGGGREERERERESAIGRSWRIWRSCTYAQVRVDVQRACVGGGLVFSGRAMPDLRSQSWCFLGWILE